MVIIDNNYFKLKSAFVLNNVGMIKNIENNMYKVCTYYFFYIYLQSEYKKSNINK